MHLVRILASLATTLSVQGAELMAQTANRPTGAPVAGRPVTVSLAWSPKPDAALGPVSNDGRFIPFNSSTDANGRLLPGRELFLHDLTTGLDRRLTFGADPTRTPGEDGPGDAWCVCAFAPDGRQIAFTRWVADSAGSNWLAELRTLSTIVASGARPVAPRVIHRKPGVWITPHGFTPDGLWVLAAIRDNATQRTQVALVSTLRDSTHVLKSIPDAQLGTIAMSPDGRLVAIQLRNSPLQSFDINLIERTTGTERPLVQNPANDRLIGWAPRSHALVFSSDRRGSVDVFAIDVDATLPEALLLRQDIGESEGLGISTNGAIHYKRVVEPRATLVVDSIELGAPGARIATLDRVQRAIYSRLPPVLPVWSPDGGQLAYWVNDRGLALVTRNPATGTERTSRVALDWLTDYAWSRDGRAIYVNGSDGHGEGAFRIGLTTGDVTRVPGVARLRGISSTAVYFDSAVGARRDSLAIVERSLRTGEGREIFRGPAGGARRLAFDPEQRVVYFRHPVPVGRPPHDLVARDVTSGSDRVVMSQVRLGEIHISPDGRLVSTMVDGVPTIIPTDGAPTRSMPGSAPPTLLDGGAGVVAQHNDPPGSVARNPILRWMAPGSREARAIRLGTGRGAVAGVATSPDGRRVAYIENEPASARGAEIWVIGNAIPASLLDSSQAVAVSVRIKSIGATPVRRGYAGYNAALMVAGIGYRDAQLHGVIGALNAGWIRFPAGARANVYDWRTGLGRQEWADQFRETLFAEQMQDAVRMLRAKGGETIVDAAALAERAGARGLIVCVNVFTDTPESAGALAAHAKARGIRVLVWQLGNEPTLLPSFFPNARAYAEKVRPFADEIRKADPDAKISLSLALAGGESPSWDSTLARVLPRYWDVLTYHQYPQVRGDDAALVRALDAVLANEVESRIRDHVRPLFGAMPVVVTEAAPGSGNARTGVSMSGTLYGGIWAAEYAARLSAFPQVWYVGMHQLIGSGGLDLTDDGREQILSGSQSTIHGPYVSAQAVAYSVATMAMNAATAAYPTSIAKSPVMATTFAQAYRTADGTALVVTNRSQERLRIDVSMNGLPVTSRLEVVTAAGALPSARNEAGLAAVATRTTTASRTVVIPPWSVSRITWR